MRELSLFLLDIAENSLKANASLVYLTVSVDDTFITITVSDDGCGMSADFLARVTDPFTTSRTTRPVGMGIPLFRDMAETTGGQFSITSTEGVGTTTTGSFRIDSIDRVPMGALEDTVTAYLLAAGQTEFVFTYSVGAQSFVFDTRQLKEQLQVDDLTETSLLVLLKDYIKDNISSINGGMLI